MLRCRFTMIVVLLPWMMITTTMIMPPTVVVSATNPSLVRKAQLSLPVFVSLRGGTSSRGSSMRFAPPIVTPAPFSKTTTTTTSPTTTTTTVTEVKEQIDAFLTRDSRNTFIGTCNV